MWKVIYNFPDKIELVWNDRTQWIYSIGYSYGVSIMDITVGYHELRRYSIIPIVIDQIIPGKIPRYRGISGHDIEGSYIIPGIFAPNMDKAIEVTGDMVAKIRELICGE